MSLKRARAVILALALLAACARNAADSSGEAGATSTSSDRQLERVAGEVVAFLQGDSPFGAIRTAPAVFLQLADEGGGTRVELAGQALADPDQWRVSGPSGVTYSFVPPESARSLELRQGRHFNCLESDLRTRAGGLAEYPHVGATMRVGEPSSCLNTWNVTFLFDRAAEEPVLVGAVYDQWEW